MSTEISTGAARKKDKSGQTVKSDKPILEAMQTETVSQPPAPVDIAKDLQRISNMCDELLSKSDLDPIDQTNNKQPQGQCQSVPQSPIVEMPPTPQTEPPRLDLSLPVQPLDQPASPQPLVVAAVEKKEKPVVKKTVNKGKTTDLSGSIKKTETIEASEKLQKKPVEEKPVVERKNSIPDEAAVANKERRKSKILETAEKFQLQNNQNNEKYKKFVIPGVSVGSFKKDFEKKATIAPNASTIGPMERKQRSIEQQSASRQTSHEEVTEPTSGSGPHTPQDEPRLPPLPPTPPHSTAVTKSRSDEVEQSGSKSSVSSFSLEDARRSMENSIALLKQAKTDSGKDMDQMVAKAETVSASSIGGATTTTEGEDDALTMNEREKKLKTAREIISNAIPRLGGGIRRPPMPYGANGRTASGTLATGYSKPVRLVEAPGSAPVTQSEQPPSFISSSGKRLFVCYAHAA